MIIIKLLYYFAQILQHIFEFVRNSFWAKFPNYAVLRNSENSKWYAIMMNIPQKHLGLEGEEYIDILDVKCDPILIGSLLNNKGYFPGYHMNKANWITLLLDGSVLKGDIFNLIDLSYELTANKKK